MDPVTQGVPGYYVWAAPGQPVTIHLKVDVIDRLGADIMRGFGLVPKRGAEVGGVLIGKVGSGGILTIDDFESVPCTYARGPSYLLTESERKVFDDVCHRRDKEIVGYFRSHTREGLALQPEDIQLLGQHFASPALVALLVKPFATKPPVAGFFVRENDSFPPATPLEFPFRRWELTGEEPPRRPLMQDRKRKEKEPQEAPASEPREETGLRPAPRHERIFSMEPPEPADPREPREAPGRKSRAGFWMVAAFVFLLLGVLLGYEASRITAPLRVSDFALSLTVERTGENLTVHWNPDALAVRSAGNGALEIVEGSDTKRVDLDRANLSNGSFVYRNVNDKVRFRLIVLLNSGLSVTQELDWPR